MSGFAKNQVYIYIYFITELLIHFENMKEKLLIFLYQRPSIKCTFFVELILADYGPDNRLMLFSITGTDDQGLGIVLVMLICCCWP